MSGLLPAYGAFDILFAAGGHSLRTDNSGFHWGDLNPIAEGGTVGMYGGTEPAPTRACVPLVQAELPKDIPIPDELLANTLPDWPTDTDGPHLGFALSERFANYALTQMYNSGAFCLGISADTLGDAVPLSTALLSVGLGANSLNELGRQKQPAPMAITLRPQQPPTLAIGGGTDIATDPLLHLNMKQVAFDFYVWSLDRYVRALTATMDLDVPANLIVTPEGLQPVIEKLGVANTTVTNADLIRENPAQIATMLEGFVGDMVGSLLGDALPPVDISTMLASTGLELQIPPTVEGKGSPGLRKLSKNNDAFLGLFATLAIASSDNMAAPSNGYAGGNSETSAQLSELRIDPAGLRLSSATADNGPRATLKLGSSLDDGSRQIEWQYKLDKGPWHPFTTERSIVVDDGWLRVQGRHVVHVRSRVVGEIYSLDPEPAEVVVWINDEGRAPPAQIDEDGPIGTSTQELRGRNISDGSGCQCLLNRPSEGGNQWAPWLLLGAIVPMLAARRRRIRRKRAQRTKDPRSTKKRLLTALSLIALSGLWAGCSCSSDVEQKPAPGCRGRGDCETLYPGLVGAYTSAAVTPDGKIWVAGYLEGNWEDQYAYGDLVVGTVDGDGVAWEAIDGVPSEPEVDIELYDPQGLRGGQTEPGEDVGLWTSIAIDSDGNPAVAYYDVTHRALRYAHLEGGRWAVNVVQEVEGSNIGRYAKLLFSNGKPIIAFQFTEPGQGGAMRSGVRVATASSAKTAGQQWTFEDVSVDEATPCRAYLCASGTACVAATGLCTEKKKDCAEDCGSDTCVAGADGSVCEPIYGNSKLDTYPEALGLYISAALRPDGSLGLAFYDRINGNLLVATKSGESWSTIIADGETDSVNNGDKGMAASLAIDAQDNFHLAYVDGLAETMSYQMVAGGTTLGTVQIVDDGMGNPDGQHLVGDDAHIIVAANGEVRISYQDATAGQLRSAVGAPAGTPNSWAIKTITQEGFAGAFSRQVEVGGALKIINWWRKASPAASGDVRLVTP